MKKKFERCPGCQKDGECPFKAIKAKMDNKHDNDWCRYSHAVKAAERQDEWLNNYSRDMLQKLKAFETLTGRNPSLPEKHSWYEVKFTMDNRHMFFREFTQGLPSTIVTPFNDLEMN